MMRSHFLLALTLTVSSLFVASCKKGDPLPQLVTDELVKVDGQYQVKGSIHNPSKHPMSVKIRYLVWGKFKGTTDERVGLVTKKTGGETTTEIKYLPAGQTVEFTAVGTESVPVYLMLEPDPLKAEIEAKWAE